MNFDVIIIGAGITGAGIAYELSKHDLKIALVDKAPFPFQGASKANSGIIHAGYDDPPGSMRAKMVVNGNKLYTTWAKELGFRFKRPGSLVIAFDEKELETIKEEKKWGDERGVPGLEIVYGDELFKLEPNLNKKAIAALLAPSAGVVCPMEVVSMLFRKAVENGVRPFLSTEVTGFKKHGEKITEVETNNGSLYGELIVNASGVFGDIISAKAGIDRYKITPRKGEYILIDPHPSYMVNHVIFPTPTRVSKGVLVIPTITGDLLIGPNAVNLSDEERENTWTTPEGLEEILNKARYLVPSVDTSLTIKTFAGIRAQPNTNDFIIEDYCNPSNFINVIGIRSPGLTSAPAIARYVKEMVFKKMGEKPDKGLPITPFIKPDEVTMALKVDPKWGKALTPHIESIPIPMMEMAAQMGIKGELYNFTCFTDKGLGVELSTTFQNHIADYLLKKGLKLEEINYRFPGSRQFRDQPCKGR